MTIMFTTNLSGNFDICLLRGVPHILKMFQKRKEYGVLTPGKEGWGGGGISGEKLQHSMT